jgi:hypothetical protein
MSIFCWTADWHLHNYPEFAHPWKDGLNSRAKHIFEVVGTWLPDQLSRRNVRILAHLGDWNLSASNDYRLVNLTREAGFACEHEVDRVVAMHGNHDTVSREAGSHNAFPYFKDPAWDITTFDDSVFWPIGYNTPVPKPSDIPAMYHGKRVFFMLHKDIEGGKTSQGFVYRNGGVKISELLAIKKCVPQARFIAGHYHQHQAIAKLVTVVGAPVQHNRGDEGQTRGVLLFDGKAFSFLEAPGPRFVSGDVLLAEELLNTLSVEERDRVYITIMIDAANAAERTMALKLIAAGLNGVIHASAVMQQAEVKRVIGGFESDSELLDRWLKEREPNLSASQRTELVRVAEAL